MKLTRVLCKQHLGRMLRYIWQVKRERKVVDTQVDMYMSKFGIEAKDPMKIVQPKKEFMKLDIEWFNPRIVFDKTHPDWKAQACLTFKDHNVLQGGFSQAQILTNTVCLLDGVTDYVMDLPDLPEQIGDIVKSAIYSANIFNAHQEKLPKKKDSARPAWVFPRDYGITSARKMRGLSRKFLQLCESLSPDIARKRCILYDGITKLNLDKESDLFQFTLRADVMVMSANPLKPMRSSLSDIEIDLPNIYPMHYTISFDKTNFYKTEDIYPISATSAWTNVHTIFIHYDPEEVKNLTELAVTEDQIFGRALMKSYTVAASCARQRFGSSVGKLPEPVVIQCVHSDGINYYFFVFQLNSLDTNDVSTKNFWHALPPLKLFEKAQYDDGRPVVDGYNPEVFRRILALYRNGA